ncbi:FAD-dependent oxidoreductase [Sedimentisphaera cyanobacteriorum]|uniref:FAD-dependent oxidoreductase n=1 Tax=Sedimentisphaera cyanobacteriorum TaxID=1940790 RepID=UPI000E54B8C4
MNIEQPADKREFRQENIQCDLAVIGGGLAGVCAAVTAAREGLSVALVQDRPVLGGNASSEVRLWALGATSHKGNNNRWSREGGVIDEILVENIYRNPEGNPVIFDTVILEKVVEEPNINLLLNTSAVKITKKENQKIESVTAFCSQNSILYNISAPLFCDASGDGVTAYLAGAEFRMGAESREEFDEKFAPSLEYGALMGHSIFFYSKDTGKPVRFVPPSYALKDIKQIPRYRNFGKNHYGCQLWWVEYGGRLDTVHDTEKIKWELWKIVYGIWDYIKNSGSFPGTENMTLEWVGMIPGKRESRRFIGDYILVQNDIVRQKEHYDAVSYGGWAIDLHPADGIYSRLPGCDQWHSKGVYQIPYRCMYSKDIENLFLAGRIMSTSHVANGSTRVMLTCAHNAQAVGMASVLCVRDKCLPRDVAEPEKVSLLQQKLLKCGQYIPGIKLEDPEDIAKEAAISVSSELKLSKLDNKGPLLTLHDSMAMLFPARKGSNIFVSFEIFADKETELIVELKSSSRIGNFTPDLLLERKKISISPKTASESCRAKEKVKLYSGADGGVNSGAAAFTQKFNQTSEDSFSQGNIEIEFESILETDQYVFICLRKNPDIHIRCSSQHITGVLSVVSKGNFRVSNGNIQKPDKDIGVDEMEFWIPQRWPNCHLLSCRFKSAIEAFGPDNLTNGFARPFKGANAWVADFDDRSPEAVLEWEKPKSIKKIELAFDTDFDHPMESVFMGHTYHTVPYCVREYLISDSQGRVVYECRENHKTRNVITFDEPVTTDKLIIQLQRPDVNIPAALFEVRCYE